MVTYPGDPPIKIEKLYSIVDGHGVNINLLSMISHNGTHVDAPKHLFADGQGVDELSLSILIGITRVIEINGADKITAKDLVEANLSGVKRLLIKTDNRLLLLKKTFHSNYTYLTKEAASYLVACGCQLVGVDYLSVDPPGDKLPAHHILLEAGIIIVESLNLSHVPVGDYQMFCLPLKIVSGDGAPARVILADL